MAEEPLIVGSNDTITGTIYDNEDGTLTPVDLSGATISIKPRLNGTSLTAWTATAHPDQDTHKGEYSYALGGTDLQTAGALELQAHITVGASVYKSKVIDREVIASF